MRYEIEMTIPIKELLISEYDIDYTEVEFSAGYGIADIVGVRYNKPQLESRRNSLFNPVTNIREIAVLEIMPFGHGVLANWIAERLGLSLSYVRGRLLRSLIEKGYVEKEGSSFCRVGDINNTADLIISVEAKLTRWREALGQAKRYQHFSNMVYVALPSQTISRVDSDLFKQQNIGLIEVKDNDSEIILEPNWIAPKNPLMHHYCHEIFFANYCLLANKQESHVFNACAPAY